MTRHPKKQKWTIKELENIPAEWKGDTLVDSEGLTGKVNVLKNGSIAIYFKYKFRWANRSAEIHCGTFPHDDLVTIRKTRDIARDQIKRGVDPRLKRKTDRIEEQCRLQEIQKQAKENEIANKTFNDMFLAWLEDGVSRTEENAELKRSFEHDVLPILENTPVNKITERDIKSIYTKILERGTKKQTRERTLIRLSNDMKQLFKWADERQPWRKLLEDGNPTLLIDINTLISKDYCEERERTLTSEEITKLHNVLNLNVVPQKTQYAIWLCLSTLCRIGELTKARWEHIDFDEKIWFIPKENVKKTNGKSQAHYIYLSEFSIKQFKLLYNITGETKWCFPSRDKQDHQDVKSNSKLIGDRQIQFKVRNASTKSRVYNNDLVIGNEEWKLHDLRRTGATIMQQLGISLDIIDRCQNHILSGSKVRRHYLKYDYKKEKSDAWKKLGEYLEKSIFNRQ